MAPQSELVIRKKRSPIAQLSPENFHVSLSNVMLGNDPVVPRDTAPAEPSEGTTQGVDSADGDEQLGGVLEESTESNQASSSVTKCEKACKKHRCLKATTNDASGKFTEESSDKPKSSKGQKQKKLKTSKTRPKDQSENSSAEAQCSEKTNQASASAPAAELSDTEAQTSGEGATSGDESGWSISEDHLLRGMKEDSRQPTWVEIAKALNRGKKDVQTRWKLIKNQPHKGDIDKDDEANTASKNPGENKPTTAKDSSKWHKGEHNTRLIAENKIAKSRAASKTATADTIAILSGEVPSSDPDSDSDHNDLGYGPCDERRRQARYLHRHVYTDLYPPSLSPAPDAYFGPRDCEVLAAVESKYQRAKWLEMQANFYNVTGRMVPLDLIREKCERAEAEEAAQRKRRK